MRLTLPGIPIRRKVSPVFDHGKGFAALSLQQMHTRRKYKTCFLAKAPLSLSISKI